MLEIQMMKVKLYYLLLNFNNIKTVIAISLNTKGYNFKFSIIVKVIATCYICNLTYQHLEQVGSQKYITCYSLSAIHL